jgi:DNA-binding CsgD family transcriptional regulator
MHSAVTLHDSAAGLASPRAQRAVLGLHRALDFADLWNALQRVFETLVPHDTLVMSVNYLDWRREATTRRLTSANSRVVDDQNSSKLVAAEGRNFFQPFLEQNPGIPCYRHTEIMPDQPDKIPDTRYYQRYMTPLGWRYSAHLLFWRDGDVETSFALRRRPDQGDFTDAEMDTLRALHPQIAVAFERVKLFEGERRRRRLLENFYRAKPEAVLFLDWDLSLLYASQEGLALCAAWKLGPEKARLYKAQAVFEVPPEVYAACATLKPRWETEVSVHHDREPEPLTTSVAAARSGYAATVTLRREGSGSLTKPLFVIRLRGPETAALPAPAQPDAAHERLRGGLTPAERELADLVCAGLSNKEIAARLKRSEGGVKVQLSGVFQKLGVNSRAKLMVALR